MRPSSPQNLLSRPVSRAFPHGRRALLRSFHHQRDPSRRQFFQLPNNSAAAHMRIFCSPNFHAPSRRSIRECSASAHHLANSFGSKRRTFLQTPASASCWSKGAWIAHSRTTSPVFLVCACKAVPGCPTHRGTTASQRIVIDIFSKEERASGRVNNDESPPTCLHAP